MSDSVNDCGDYVYDLISVAWDRQGEVPNAYQDDGDEVTLEGGSSADYGMYTFTFDVSLFDYSLPSETFSFSAEIVPDCAASAISAVQAVSFTTALTGTS